uniref:Bm2378 n=1 Tax=Brugia malayi TaxID=6279 RepID=A0A1I9G0I8_BRUMA|nr:Bm2378 [Brugia malayi]
MGYSIIQLSLRFAKLKKKMTVRNYFIEKIPMIENSFYDYFLEIIKQFGNQMRNALIRLGIQSGDTIGTYVNNSSHYIIFILAAISIGAILVPLNPSYKIC